MASERYSLITVASVLLFAGIACSLGASAGKTEPPSQTPLPPSSTPLSTSLSTPLSTSTATELPTSTESPVPPSPTPRPPTLPPQPTHTRTRTPVTPSATLAPTSTRGGIIIATFIFPRLTQIIIQPPPAATLDYTANPNYGSTSLSAGFSPDPFSVGMTSGGDVNVSYLGGGCAGFATSSPDFRVNYSGGGATLLRFYFIGSSGDSTMIVNDPYGNFYCVDDSFGTLNPTIDFNNPAGGTYDIWVGSYTSGTFISGTLYITGNSGNHP